MEFSKKKRLEVIAEYRDIAQGATFEREQFRRMLSDLESGKVKANYILVTRWDRFCHNLNGALDMIKQLRAHNLKVVSLQDFESKIGDYLTFPII